MEGHCEVQRLRKEATEKEWLLNEALTQKAAEDQAQHKQRADISYIFTGPLNKARRKEELDVKALQGLGMLNMSVVLWVQGSVAQWFDGSDEGTSPS